MPTSIRFILVATVAVLSGCVTGSNTGGLDVPEVPKVSKVDTYADIQDLANTYAAASVTVAKELVHTKPDVATLELNVALANLPKPTATSLAEARSRAEAKDPIKYGVVLKKADELQVKLDEAWYAVEREKSRNDALELKLKSNLAEQVAREKSARIDAMATKCTWLGGLMLGAGVLAFALSSYLPINKLTAPVCVGLGTVLMALPLFVERLVDWEYFQPLVVGTVTLLLTAFAVHWFLVHRSSTK